MEYTNKSNRNSYLPKTNAITEGIEEAWTGNNEQWWNWYVSLADDDFLCKEPDCGRTPWHYDGHHYPIASHNVVTLWMPLQPTPKEMGPLEFAKGIETYKLLKEIAFFP